MGSHKKLLTQGEVSRLNSRSHFYNFAPGWQQYVCSVNKLGIPLPTDTQRVPKPKRLFYYHKSSKVSWLEVRKFAYSTKPTFPPSCRFFSGKIPNFFTISFSTDTLVIMRFSGKRAKYPKAGLSAKSDLLVDQCITTNLKATALTPIHGHLIAAVKCYKDLFTKILRKISKIYGSMRNTTLTRCTFSWPAGQLWSSICDLAGKMAFTASRVCLPWHKMPAE